MLMTVIAAMASDVVSTTDSLMLDRELLDEIKEAAMVPPEMLPTDIDTTPLRLSFPFGHAPEKIANDSNRDWMHLLFKGYFNPKDTTVHYSKFMKLFNAVYNWGDRVFNTYDSTYVVGFGKNWKIRLALDAWTDSYAMNLNKHANSTRLPMLFLSEPYASIGAYLHFMAVSVNYTVDIGKTFLNKPIHHKKFEFAFNCARFAAELSFSRNSGGTYIRKFGQFNDGKFIRTFFPGLELNTANFQVYYFFNNFKYANGAAYNFSRLQLKSAGSWIAGFNYTYQNLHLDFSQLPENMLKYLTWENKDYRFHYNNYCIQLGYGYNWVWNRHLLFNITVMPALGFSRAYQDSADGGNLLMAMNIAGKMSITYNLKDLFVCLVGKGNGQWYRSTNNSVFSAILNAQLSIGYRF